MITMDELPAKTTMSKRKSYDVSFKLKAIECAEKTSKKQQPERWSWTPSEFGNGARQSLS